jgi:hypothetical protein
MFRQDAYVREKLEELARQRTSPMPEPPGNRRPRKHLLGPIARSAGHRMRHLGEALEAWAAPAPRNAPE